MIQKICVVGLGYVGLPLAIAFSKHFSVLGFDINPKRIDELKIGIDKTNEIQKDELVSENLEFTANPMRITEANFVIVAVPTPIDDENKPDLTMIRNASKIVGQNLPKKSIIVYESTVYPGVTEEICKPILEEESGLKCGVDFKIGYSPERINPGDKEHTLDKVVKVVSGMDEETLNIVAETYSKCVSAGVFRAKNIKTAEAAKVIENIQRDLNIALMNELFFIFEKLGLEMKDVLEAAETKWNFHKYRPGLVGGHCIGVDPYYLAHRALELGYVPKVILAGREINEAMSKYVANYITKKLKEIGKDPGKSKILIWGLSFKENVLDIRNSKIKDVINHLREYHPEIVGYDPLIEEDFEKNFSIKKVDFESISQIDCLLIFSPHQTYRKITLQDLRLKMTLNNPILFDVKGFYDQEEAVKLGFIYKRL